MPRDLDGGTTNVSTVCYFGPDRSQGTVRKRIKSFQDAGWEVIGFTFGRVRRLGRFEPFWFDIDLGDLSHGNYARRIGRLLEALVRGHMGRDHVRSADLLYARNLDLALLAMLFRWLSRSRAAFYYEVNDIRGVLLRSDLTGRLARWAERRVLSSCDRLVTSSPWFLSEYFEAVQGYTGPSFVLENRIYAADLDEVGRDRVELVANAEQEWRNGAERLVIGWFGVLDCQETWEALKRVAADFPETVGVYLRGYPEHFEEDFFATVESAPNLEFGGAFDNRTDLPEMYRRVHVVCGFDAKELGRNSTWLLPNSLYETGALCRPLLAQTGTATGDRVERLGTGWIVDRPFDESLVRFVRDAFDWDVWIDKVRAAAEVPIDEFAGQRQFEELLALVER